MGFPPLGVGFPSVCHVRHEGSPESRVGQLPRTTYTQTSENSQENSCSTTFVNKGNNRAEVARTQRLLPYSPEYLEGEVPEVCPYGVTRNI